MTIRWLAALGLATIGGCAACQPCRAVTPSAQASPQYERHDAPVPPRVPPQDDEDLPPLPPLPVPSPGPREPEPTLQPRKTGRVTTTREVEGAAVVIEQHAPGVIVVNSPGATPTQPQSMAAASPAPQSYPLIPGPVPDSLIYAAARRIGGGLYYAATGKCPPPRQPQMQALVPVTSYQAVPVQMAAAPAPAPVQYVAVPVAAQAPAPPAALPTPQAARKHWFSR